MKIRDFSCYFMNFHEKACPKTSKYFIFIKFIKIKLMYFVFIFIFIAKHNSLFDQNHEITWKITKFHLNFRYSLFTKVQKVWNFIKIHWFEIMNVKLSVNALENFMKNMWKTVNFVIFDEKHHFLMKNHIVFTHKWRKVSTFASNFIIFNHEF